MRCLRKGRTDDLLHRSDTDHSAAHLVETPRVEAVALPTVAVAVKARVTALVLVKGPSIRPSGSKVPRCRIRLRIPTAPMCLRIALSTPRAE